MKTIRVLTRETINQIAAGEVIENPASVIKELVENSLDAGASHLTIEVKGGGFQLIKVADDGSGMNGDDALLCFERHATSKISGIEDLSSLDSMGFRGEALASIASISRVDLTTALLDGHGTRIEIEGGKILSVALASRKRGTTFEVRSLFYNVPARKKFQKQASASLAEIHRQLITAALAHPEIGFELISNESSHLRVLPARGSTLLEKLHHRIEDLFHNSFLPSRLTLQGSERGYEMYGFIGTPSDHRVNRTGQYLFVNRRSIFAPQVSRAIKEGYGERLGKDRYPTFVLNLNVPPASLDVNVHPQKKEVRFQEGDFIWHFVRRNVQQEFGSPQSPLEVIDAPVHFYSDTETAPLVFRESEESHSTFSDHEQVIGIFDRFLLLDASTVSGYQPGIIWVDLQKAQQEIIWRALTNSESKIPAQGLLIPLNMPISSLEAHQLPHHLDEITRCGFSVQLSGKHHLLVDAVPPFLDELDAIETLRIILGSEEAFPELAKKIARFAVRKKKNFALQEALAIWRKRVNSSEAVKWTGDHVIENFFK